ncbi:MAG: acyltransferase family protein [Bacteroidales bacterium]
MDKERIGYIDFIKGAAIFLVVWGHSVQYASVESYYFFDNTVFKIIYAFHMPLFMLLSGLFFEKSISMPFLRMVKKRYLQWVLPAIVFAALLVIPSLYNGGVDQSADLLIKRVIYPAPYWYVAALFFCVIVSSVFYKLFKGRIIIAATASTLLILLLPDISIFLTPEYKFMLPYFWLGAIISRYSYKYSKSWVTAVVPLMLFVVVFLLQREQCFIYSKSFSSISVNFFPFMVIHKNPLNISEMASLYGLGLFGSMAIYFVLKKIYPSIKKSATTKWFAYIGKNTLGIYFISILINHYVSCFVSLPANPELLYDLLYTITYSIATIFLCLIIITFITKSELMQKILLGIYK